MPLSKVMETERFLAAIEDRAASLPEGEVDAVRERLALARSLLGTQDPLDCGSAWKRDPGSGVIGVEKGPLIPVV